MKICVFADLHGNYEALQKLAQTSDFLSADQRIFMGDAVGLFWQSNLCINLLRKYNCIYLYGNHEKRVLKELKDHFNKGNDVIAHYDYLRNNITKENYNFLKALQKDYTYIYKNTIFYFCHYAWKGSQPVARPSKNTAKNIAEIFKNVQANYIFYGHEHSQSELSDNQKTYIDVGSIGMKCPGNYYVINIDEQNDQIIITHKTIEYDIEKVKKEALDLNYPLTDYVVNHMLFRNDEYYSDY